MNTFKKVVVGTVLGAVAMLATANSAVADANVGAGVLNMASRVTGLVAGDVAAEMRAALQAPRTYATRQSPSVVIAAIGDVETSVMETMVVEATRLPHEEMPTEEIVVAATRLPSEEIVVAATRLPARDTTLVASSAF
jgi:hypothetical protein